MKIKKCGFCVFLFWQFFNVKSRPPFVVQVMGRPVKGISGSDEFFGDTLQCRRGCSVSITWVKAFWYSS